jgi:hypothetical protein
MDELVQARRKSTPAADLRRLFALSGNVCAFPACMHPIFDKEGVYVAQLAHIEAAEDGGPRFRGSMTDDERAAFENLLFFCYEHHKVTDDEGEWPTPRLHKLKADHEAKFTDARLFGQVEDRYLDYTALNRPRKGGDYVGFREFLRLTINEPIGAWVNEYADRLAQVDRPQRQLLLIIGECMLDGNVTTDQIEMKTRRPPAEIVKDMGLLEKYGLAWVDADTFERVFDVRIDFKKYETPPLMDMIRFAKAKGVLVESLIVDMNLSLLD